MTVVLTYTQSILKRAIWNYISRVYVKKVLGLSVLAIFLVVLNFTYDAPPWEQALTLALVVFIPAMFILGYWFRIRESLKRLNMLDKGQLTMTLTESGTVAISALGKSESNWIIYSELWEFPTNYLLFYMGSQFITLPKDQVTPEFIAFIKSKLAANPKNSLSRLS